MWWKFPMKPVRMREDGLARLDLSAYTMEKKYDGHRAVLLVEGKRASLWTRHRTPIAAPADLMEQVASLELPDGTVLDGEIWNPLKRGGWTSEGREPSSLAFWDCVREGRKDLGASPIEERREALRRLLRGGPEEVRFVGIEEPTRERVREVFLEAVEVRRQNRSRSGFVHGVVLKKNGSTRRDHATKSHEDPTWLKVVFDGMPGWPA